MGYRNLAVDDFESFAAELGGSNKTGLTFGVVRFLSEERF